MDIKKFDSFVVKIDGGEYDCNPGEELAMDEATINEDLKNQPSWYAWYASLYEKAESQHQMDKLVLEITEAEVYGEVRNGLVNATKKPTEAQIRATVMLNERYQQARMKVLESKKSIGLVKAVKEGFQHRKETLIALASNMRVQSDPAIFVKTQEFKGGE